MTEALVLRFQELAPPGECIAIDKWTLTSIMEKGKRSTPPTLGAEIGYENVRSAERRWRGMVGRRAAG